MTAKLYLIILALAATSALPARADGITVIFDTPDQAGSPGETIQYFGVITNTGTDTVYLNSDDINLDGGPDDFTFSDASFYANTPSGYLDGGASTGDIELFDVTINDPFPDALYTSYEGDFTLLGGVDGGSADVLAVASFSATVVPEPAGSVLFMAGLTVVGTAVRFCGTSQRRSIS